MDDKRSDLIRRSRLLLCNPYAHLDGDGDYDALLPAIDDITADRRAVYQNPYRFIDDINEGVDDINAEVIIDQSAVFNNLDRPESLSRVEVERVARSLLVELWNCRNQIFSATDGPSPIDVVDPLAALSAIGFKSKLVDTIGQFKSNSGDIFEVAGMLDRDSKRVSISQRYALPVRNFTAAHELGHAVLHENRGVHRDRPLDGTRISRRRTQKEKEADWFATYFLMPSRLVMKEFERRFLTTNFFLTEDTAFALGGRSLSELKDELPTMRDLSRALAEARGYNGVFFETLAEQFAVSRETMAIRLEELQLVLSNSGQDYS